MQDNINEQIIRQVYNDFAQGNITGILEALTDDVKWELPGYPDIPVAGSYKGKTAVMEFFRNLNDYIEFIKFEATDFYTAGNRVIAFGVDESRARQTGKTASEDWAMLWELENGKVVSYRSFEDTNAGAKSFRK